jgi:hypothetical protein
MNAIQKLFWASVIGCLGCTPEPSISFQDETRIVSIDVSSKNEDGMIGGSGFYVGTSSFKRTEDVSISDERLASFLEEVRGDQGHLLVSCQPKNSGVFYVAHNGKSRTRVMLELVAKEGVVLNGKAHHKAFPLAAGAHGFRVVSQGAPVEVEHVFLPYE